LEFSYSLPSWLPPAVHVESNTPMAEIIDIDPRKDEKGRVTVLPQQAPPLAVSFDVAALIKSPSFWFLAGAATAWYFMKKGK